MDTVTVMTEDYSGGDGSDAGAMMLGDQHCGACAGHKVQGQPMAGGHTELPSTSPRLTLPGPVLDTSAVLGRTFYFLINPTVGHLLNTTSCPLSQCLASPSHLGACMDVPFPASSTDPEMPLTRHSLEEQPGVRAAGRMCVLTPGPTVCHGTSLPRGLGVQQGFSRRLTPREPAELIADGI